MNKQDSKVGSGIREEDAACPEIREPSRCFSIKKTAEIFDTSERTVYRQLARGDLDGVYLGGSTKVTSESIERRIASLPKFVSKSRDARA